MKELFKTNRWYLLSTKSRSEKIAYDNLYNQNHETFLPTLAHTDKPAPLFPGYIFVKPRLGASYVSIKSTRGVNQFIKFGDVFPVISESLIKFLRARIENFEAIITRQNKYQKGQIVYVENVSVRTHRKICQRLGLSSSRIQKNRIRSPSTTPYFLCSILNSLFI